MVSKHVGCLAMGLMVGSSSTLGGGASARSLSQDDARIINGQVANVADYPFLVSLRAYDDGFGIFCGGTVLHPRVVLTAAHCITPEPLDSGGPLGSPYNSINNFKLPVVVTAADVPVDDINDENGEIPATSLVPTKAVVTSAGWNGFSPNGYDLALLLLEEDLVGVEVASLPAAGTTYTSGEAFNIAGWGSTSPVEEILPPTLMEATVNYVPTETCYDDLLATGGTNILDEGLKLDGTWMCAQGAFVDGFYTDTCQGDSGGPMSIINGNGDATVVGVVSWGFGCGGNTPGVYTNVEHFTPWIERWLSVWERKGWITEYV